MSTKANTTSPASEKALGERAVDQILLAWKGDFAGDACIAATQIGLLHSGNMLGYDHAKTILKFHFGVRKVDDIHWSTVYQAFQNGRATVVSNVELRNRFFPAAANDNQRFQVTWFDEVCQTVTKDELGSRLIRSTIGVQRPNRRRPGNFVPVCRIGLRCA
jgi:hypothetical protein